MCQRRTIRRNGGSGHFDKVTDDLLFGEVGRCLPDAGLSHCPLCQRPKEAGCGVFEEVYKTVVSFRGVG